MVTSPPQSLSSGKVTLIFSAHAALLKGLSMLTPSTWVSAASSFCRFCLEVLHFLGSTTGKGKDIERECDVFLALEIMERDLVPEGLVDAR